MDLRLWSLRLCATWLIPPVFLALLCGQTPAAESLPDIGKLLEQCQEVVRTSMYGRSVINQGDHQTTYYEGRGALTRSRDQCIRVLYSRPAGTRFGTPCAAAYASRLQKSADILKLQLHVARKLRERVVHLEAQISADMAELEQAKEVPAAIRSRCMHYVVEPRKKLRIAELASAGKALNAALKEDKLPAIRISLGRVQGAWWQLAELIRWSELNIMWSYQDLSLAIAFIKKHPKHEYVGAILDVPGIHDLVERFYEIRILIQRLESWFTDRDVIAVTQPTQLHSTARKPYIALLTSVENQPRVRDALEAALRMPYECLFLAEQLRRYEAAQVMNNVAVLCRRWAQSTPRQKDMRQEVCALMEVLCDRQGSTEPNLNVTYRFHEELMEAGGTLAGKTREEAYHKVFSKSADTIYKQLCPDKQKAKEIFGQANLACYRKANIFAVALANGGFGGSYPFLSRYLRFAGQRPTRHNVVGFELGSGQAFSEKSFPPVGQKGFPVPADVQDTDDAYVFGHSFYRSLTAWVAERYYLPPNQVIIRTVPYYGQEEKIETVTPPRPKP